MTDQLRDTVIRTTIDSLTRGELAIPAAGVCYLTLLPINVRPFPHVIHNQFIDPVSTGNCATPFRLAWRALVPPGSHSTGAMTIINGC
jgi:hypothetical protein